MSNYLSPQSIKHKFDCTKMSKSFIKPDDSGLNFCENIPTLKKNTPVIACIGSSRDGKSTALNLYLNYISRHGEIHKGEFKEVKLNCEGK